MPSFFFHIALDLDGAPLPRSSSQNPDQLIIRRPVEDLSITHPGPEERFLTNSKSSKSDSLEPTTSPSTSHDWRYDKIFAQDFSMASMGAQRKEDSEENTTGRIRNGISAGPGGLATKGKYEACNSQQEGLGWGVVRLFRDAEETPGLYDEPSSPRKATSRGGLSKKGGDDELPFRDEDCTTLCILAVPSYLTPSDFLGFVGEKTRDQVSHIRMIRTEKGNRYMVLMKFRNGKKAREWRREWNGKPFDGMEPENCHVVFVKSIEFQTHEIPGQESSFPDMTNDPFTPSVTKAIPSTPATKSSLQSTSLSSNSRSSKPPAPPTPALIELPTCPVCLERMDESTGLLTILCQHVFHCSCLQKWRGSGCPVCRYTQDNLGLGKRTNNNSNSPEAAGLNECSVWHSDANLWICLICGNVGCGRYDAAHAFSHYSQSLHCFAMDMNTQRVWDYASDGYVHRIVQDKTDGKLVEVTPTSAQTSHDDDFDDYVPREKLDNIGLEYAHLLTSQLESQRMYFEEILERAADKASQASSAAEKATEVCSKNAEQLATLQASHDALLQATIPELEKDRDRATRKAEKFEAMARKLEKEWRDEKAMNESLMTRINHLGTQLEMLKTEKSELEEQNRDLSFFISGTHKLKSIGVDEEEVREGTVSLPEVEASMAGKGKKKGGGKGKK